MIENNQDVIVEKNIKPLDKSVIQHTETIISIIIALISIGILILSYTIHLIIGVVFGIMLLSAAAIMYDTSGRTMYNIHNIKITQYSDYKIIIKNKTDNVIEVNLHRIDKESEKLFIKIQPHENRTLDQIDTGGLDGEYSLIIKCEQLNWIAETEATFGKIVKDKNKA